jgi:hypothetical protein
MPQGRIMILLVSQPRRSTWYLMLAQVFPQINRISSYMMRAVLFPNKGV